MGIAEQRHTIGSEKLGSGRGSVVHVRDALDFRQVGERNSERGSHPAHFPVLVIHPHGTGDSESKSEFLVSEAFQISLNGVLEANSLALVLLRNVTKTSKGQVFLEVTLRAEYVIQLRVLLRETPKPVHEDTLQTGLQQLRCV